MELSTWLLYSSIALIAIISPGPAVLLCVTNSLTHGFEKSVFSSLGNITGIFIVSSASILGLGAVLHTSPRLFMILKIFGAIYLIYLGIRQWKSKQNLFEKALATSQYDQRKSKYYVQGVSVSLSNPKAILFFTALFPQFIDLSKPILMQFTILTATFMLISFTTLIIYALSAYYAKGWFAKRNRAMWLNRISGAIFITLGLGILRLENKSA